jgi:hypothetical protein
MMMQTGMECKLICLCCGAAGKEFAGRHRASARAAQSTTQVRETAGDGHAVVTPRC